MTGNRIYYTTLYIKVRIKMYVIALLVGLLPHAYQEK